MMRADFLGKLNQASDLPVTEQSADPDSDLEYYQIAFKAGELCVS